MALGACGGDRDPRFAGVVDDPTVASPLNQLLGISSVDAGAAANEAAAQRAIARCMSDVGFTYVPIAPPTDIDPNAGGIALAGDTLEEIQQVGYGVADALVADTLAAGADIEDPNEAIRASLSDEERAAYDTAMSGISSSEVIWDEERGPIDPVTEATIDFSEFREVSADGCLSKAYADGPVITEGALRLLTSRAYQDLQTRIQSDAELVELQQGWRACMAARGYRYEDRTAILNDLLGTSDEIHHEATEDHHATTDAEVADMVEDLRRREIETATVDFECSAELLERGPGVARRYEIEFIDDNEDLILAALDEAQR